MSKKLNLIYRQLLKGENRIQFDFEGCKVSGTIKQINLESNSIIARFDKPFNTTRLISEPVMFSMDEDATTLVEK